MIKQLAWNTFKNTGNIDTYMELVKFQNIQKSIENASIMTDDTIKVNDYGDNKDQGIDNFGK